MSQWTDKIKEILASPASITATIQEELRKTAKKMIEDMLETVFESKRKDLSIKGAWQRNGTYQRSLVSIVGLINDITIPRARKASFSHELFVPFQRRQQEVDLLLAKLFIQGESYRDLQRVMRLLFGDSIGLSTITRLTNRLYAQVQALTMPALKEQYDILWLDGIYFPVKQGHHTGSIKRVGLAALGHNVTTNRDELLGYVIAESESEASYSHLLKSLLKRGLRWREIEVIVHDGDPSISAAVENLFGDQIPQQDCIFHKLKNIRDAVRHRESKYAILHDASHIYEAPTLEEYCLRLKAFTKSYRRKEPDVVKCISDDRFIVTQYTLSEHLRTHLHTTNPLDRKFREVRRRTNIIGCFEHSHSLDKIMFFLVQFINQTAGVPPVFTQLAITHN